MHRTSALTLRDVDAFYGDSHVLQKVSFSLGEGCLLGLLGRNGAGKTTCMNVTVGLLPPRGGDVVVFGTDRKSTRLNSSHLGISYAVFCLKKKRIASGGVPLCGNAHRPFAPQPQTFAAASQTPKVRCAHEKRGRGGNDSGKCMLSGVDSAQ